MLLTIKRQQARVHLAKDSSVLESDTLLTFRHLIETQYTEHLSVKDYASQLHISVSSLNRLCKTKLRISPKAIIHKRLECEAKRKLIYTKQSIESIAYALGFKDAGYFCRFFKRSTGATASEFRDSHTFS